MRKRVATGLLYGLALLAAAAVALWLAHAVAEAQAARGIRGGFHFLWQQAGFQIAESLLPVTAFDSYGRAILAGLVNTAMVAAIAIPLATALGILIGLVHLFAPRPIAALAGGFIELFRNTPVLLQLFVWYSLLLQLPAVRGALQPLPGVLLSNRGLVVPAVTGGWAWLFALGLGLAFSWRLRRRPAAFRLGTAGIALLALAGLPPPVIETGALQGFSIAGGWQLSPELAALLIGLVLFHAAYIAAIARAGIEAVPLGQIEAARALGLGTGAIGLRVVAPYARRVATPPLLNQYLTLIKNSTLAVAIGYPDLMAVINTVINQTGQAIEASALALAAYLLVSLAMAGAVNLHYARSAHGLSPDGATLRFGDRPRPAATERPSLARRAWLALLALPLLLLAFLILRWALIDAVWSGPAEACAATSGACWAAIVEKHRLLLFGTLPPAARPQALAAIALAAGGLGWALLHQGRGKARSLPALALIVAAPVALHGGFLGLSAAPMTQWGGLVVTVLLAVYSISLALPLAILLALARRSGRPFWAVPATALIETIRGVPLILLLFVSASVLPLVLGGLDMPKMLLVLVALTLHTAANLAEVLRGALEAVPEGQMEAARSLGLRPSQGFRLVVWPQALRIAMPPGIGTVIGAIKDTSLVLVIGVFDLLSAAKAATADMAWWPYALEIYLAVAAFYFLVCHALSLYSERLRRKPA